MIELNKRLQEELKAIGMYQPVFAGDLLSKGDTQVLKSMGLCLTKSLCSHRCWMTI